jgi:sugar (pentulose or hexulose) kinase
MEELGAPVRELRVSGGTAESAVLNQLKADVTGRPVRIPAHREAELAGLGVIGAAALGRYATFAEAAASIIHWAREYTPNPASAPVYEEGFARYRELYRSLKPLW